MTHPQDVEPETFGAFLKRIRTERKLTQRDVERITEGKVSNPYLSQLEGGKIASPGVIMLHRLSAAYGIDFGDLCQRTCIGHHAPATPDYCPTCGQVI